MTTFEIQVPDDVARKIEAAAQQSGVSVEQFVAATMQEKLANDAAFDAAATRVVEGNAELYRRLAK